MSEEDVDILNMNEAECLTTEFVMKHFSEDVFLDTPEEIQEFTDKFYEVYKDNPRQLSEFEDLWQHGKRLGLAFYYLILKKPIKYKELWALQNRNGTSLAHYAAAHGLLPKDFNQWHIVDSSGWDVATQVTKSPGDMDILYNAMKYLNKDF